MSRFFLLLLLSFFTAQIAFAQFQFYPIPQKSSPKIKRKSIMEDTVFSTLPFFEDFSNPSEFPDPTKWQNDETTPFVSSGYGIQPPSIYVATFDGAQRNGTRYDEENLSAVGVADHLTSVYFDLSEYEPSDSLYISFFWQAKGLGDKPNTNSFLRLQFRDRDGDWQNLWEISGNGNADTIVIPFEEAVVAITDTAAFHEYFAFRFQNTGKLSGSYDHWHLDYVFFHQNNQEIRNDLAISEQATSLLKNYFAMPIDQFREDELADTIYSSIQNNSESLHIFAPRIKVTDLYTGDTKANIPVEALGEIPFTKGDTTFIITSKENMDLIGLQTASDYEVDEADSLALEYSLYFDKIEAEGLYVDDTVVTSFESTFYNDTLKSIVRLEDYFAYDDGVGEYAAIINQIYGQVAYRFVLNEPDYITDVDMYFPQIYEDLNGQAFNLLVWQKIDFDDPEDDEIVSRLSVAFVYPDTLNEFRRLSLSEPVLLQDTFYVGYEQLSEEPLIVGWDKNHNTTENIFFNVYGEWAQTVSSSNYSGSLMIRPVFGEVDIVSGIDEDLSELQKITVFPNPASDIIYIEGEADQYILTDITGKTVLQGSFSNRETTNSITLNSSLSGLYILVLQKNQARIAKKILVK